MKPWIGSPPPIPQAAELVKLYYFGGLTIEQAAGVLGVSARKAYNIWAYARAWLFRCLDGRGFVRGVTRLFSFLVQLPGRHVALGVEQPQTEAGRCSSTHPT